MCLIGWWHASSWVLVWIWVSRSACRLARQVRGMISSVCKLARCQMPDSEQSPKTYTLLPLEIPIRLSPPAIIIQRPSINHRCSHRTRISRELQHPFRLSSLGSLSRHGLSALFLFCSNSSRNRFALRLRTGTRLGVTRETLSFGTWRRRFRIFFRRCSTLHKLFNWLAFMLAGNL